MRHGSVDSATVQNRTLCTSLEILHRASYYRQSSYRLSGLAHADESVSTRQTCVFTRALITCGMRCASQLELVKGYGRSRIERREWSQSVSASMWLAIFIGGCFQAFLRSPRTTSTWCDCLSSTKGISLDGNTAPSSRTSATPRETQAEFSTFIRYFVSPRR